MIIRSVCVKEFGTLQGPITVDFDQGLNLIHGPNETGKSTLMKAVWYALTRRATSNAQGIRAIQPTTGGTPEVQVTLEIKEAVYTLKKCFDGSSGRTHLQVQHTDGTVEDAAGDQADELLREAIGFGKASGRTKTPEHYGIWPVTWVWQGNSGNNPGTDLAEKGRTEELSQVLAQLSGEVLAGSQVSGLFQKVREEYERYYTSSGNETKRSGAPLYEAQQRLEKLQQTNDELEQQQKLYEADLEEYAQLKQTCETLAESLPKLQAEAQQAQEQLEQVSHVRQQKETADAKLAAATGELQQLKRRLARREQLQESIGKLKDKQKEQEKELARQKKRLAEHQQQQQQLKKKQETAVEAQADKARRVKMLEAHRTLLEGRSREEDAQQQLNTVETYQEQLAETNARLASITVDEKMLDRLENLRAQRDKTQATLKAAAAHVRLRGLKALTVEIDGEPCKLTKEKVEEYTVDTTTTVHISDQVVIEITPGGENLSEVRKAARQAEDKYKEALEKGEIASFQEAKKLLRRRSSLEGERSRLKELLKQVAPEGVQAVREQLNRVKHEVEKAKTLRDNWPEKTSDLPDNKQELRALLEKARKELELARQKLDEHKERFNAHVTEHEKLNGRVQLVHQKCAATKERLQEASQDLAEAAAEEGTDKELKEALIEAKKTQAAQTKEVETYTEKLKKLNPERLEAEAKRTEDVLENTEQELAQKRTERTKVETRLGSVNLHGLHEKRKKAKEAVRQAKADLGRWKKKAAAAKLLYETLHQSKAQARKAHLAPLREEVEDLLGQFYRAQENSVQFDENFELVRLNRPSDGSYGFDQLSNGAREQLSVIVRLAMARLTKDGEPFPVFIDEAFSDTDTDRFKAMANILRMAARDLQIILTTCHLKRYRQLGVGNTIDLAGLQRTSAVTS